MAEEYRKETENAYLDKISDISLVVIYCIAYGVSYAKHGTIIEFWRGPKFLKMW